MTAPHTSPEPKYPDVEVQLTGEDGNVFFIIGRVCAALKRADVSEAEIEAYTNECTSGDYDHALRTTMRWVTTA